ncbi:MAG: hypothetical protein R3E77_16425 [Steroidobacteraceae bacterium]
MTLARIPMWFRAIAGLSLLWFLMDLFSFYMRVFQTDAFLQSMPPDQQSLFRDIPSWVNVVYGAEVFGGVLGSLALLFRREWAMPLFLLSFIGVVCQTFYVEFLSDAIRVMGKPAIVMPLLSILIGVGMIVATRTARVRNWLGQS